MTDSGIDKQLKRLDELERAHLDLGAALHTADGGNIFPLDLLATGACSRSIGLLSGFRSLVRQRNWTAAVPLIRLQLDTALRFGAGTLVDKPHDFALDVLRGERISAMRDRTGAKMTDRHLIDTFSQHFPWITSLYDEGCGHVHLSERHIFGSIAGLDDPSRTIQFAVSARSSLPDTAWVEALDAFAMATDLFLRFLGGWIVSKDPDAAARLREEAVARQHTVPGEGGQGAPA